jgi:septum formation protein
MEAFCTAAPLVLASASPRRRQYLSELGLHFTVRAADLDETPRAGEGPEAFVRRLAQEKAAAVAGTAPAAWVLAADTVVAVDGEILGKPKNGEEAVAMLLRLSGRWHEVWTAFCLCRQAPSHSLVRAVRTGVRFITLDRGLCLAYVRSGEPLDKAGAYGIQGKGAFLVEEIRGSYSNVVGLPLAEVLTALLSCGVVSTAADRQGGAA